MSLTITPQQIIDHRAARKTAGLVGCITGRPVPEMNFFGYSDVQSWRPADPMQPHCFCFDCRELWDKDAAIDFQLVLDGHQWARETYATLLPMEMRPAPRPAPKLALPMRSNGGGIGWGAVPSLMPDETSGQELSPYTDDAAVPAPVPTPPTSPASVPLLPRVSTSQPRYGSFGEVPMSLPAPRARDIMNESPDERLKGDLAVLQGKLQGDLVVVMDRRRNAVCYDDAAEKAAFLAQVDKDEAALWRKLDAVKVLLEA
jgi:hypothetical protein